MRQVDPSLAAGEADIYPPPAGPVTPARRPLILECLLVGVFAACVLMQVFVLLPGQQEVLRAYQDQRREMVEQQREDVERLRQIKDLQQRVLTNNARIIVQQEKLLREEK